MNYNFSKKTPRISSSVTMFVSVTVFVIGETPRHCRIIVWPRVNEEQCTLGFHWYISGFAHRHLYRPHSFVYPPHCAQPGNGPKKFGININITEKY